MNILTFDIEDWFHILDNPHTKGEKQWNKFESRLSQNLDIILSVLSDFEQKATFFCVGWVAEQHPEQIRRIVDADHELGSHTTFHQLIYEQTQDTFREDLKRSIDVLKQISGVEVPYFRAPGFSITESTPWAFEELLAQGIKTDSSVFPASRAHGGFSSFGSAKPSIIELNGMQLKEFPINTYGVLGKDIIFSGGGYFRLFPYWLIKHFSKKSDYIMTYFHPRDFDAGQPMIPGLSPVRKFKSYYGLASTEPKLRQWLTDFEFVDLKQAVESVDWDKAKKVIL